MSRGSHQPLRLHDDRFFDPNPAFAKLRAVSTKRRGTSRSSVLTGTSIRLLLADNTPFPEPTALLIIPDHYIFRMLYSRGVSMESLGIPTVDGTPVEADPRKIWQRFAEHYHLFRGTPTGRVARPRAA